MILSMLKFNIKVGRHLAFSFMVLSLWVFEKNFQSRIRTLSNTDDEVFLAEVANAFQPLPILAKKLRHSCSK